jgi:hypothetical protein
MDVLHKLEGLETTKSGIFVMPKERVAIHSTYWYLASKPLTLGMLGECMCIKPVLAVVSGSFEGYVLRPAAPCMH